MFKFSQDWKNSFSLLSIDRQPKIQMSTTNCMNRFQIFVFIIMPSFFGDFNLPVTVWGKTLNSHSGHELYSNILESSLYQHIYEPTCGESILDIVLSTNDNQSGPVV